MSSPAIDELDPTRAGEADLAAVWALEVALEREALPAEPVPPVEQSVVEYRHQPSYQHRRWWVARQGTQVVGQATCAFNDLPENRSHALVNVMVAPEARRASLGTALFTLALGATEEWGCTLLDIEARVGGPGAPFLQRLGAELRLVSRRSACRFEDLDRPMLEAWVRRSRERAAGYSIVTWDGPCPEQLIEAYADIKHVMNTAPLESLEREDDRFTPALCRAGEAARLAQGYEWSTVCARHEGSGELVGYTDVLFPRYWPTMAHQEDTGVWPKHRNRGLGRWIKAAMALRVLDERPAVRRIETWNAGSNEAMLNINVAMGFQPLENWGEWQVSTESARAGLRI
jgi:GNAT superfamily N-acetyltransferase